MNVRRASTCHRSASDRALREDRDEPRSAPARTEALVQRSEHPGHVDEWRPRVRPRRADHEFRLLPRLSLDGPGVV